MTSYFKTPSIVSKALRDSARGEKCTLRVTKCEPGTVVLCHINSAFKGMGNKSPDLFSYYGCRACHALETTNKVDAWDILRAMQETQMKFYEKGLITIKGVKQ